jgi:antitoxin (DNA-binding transcriptional repressor) of toxin-antitoxin stability system
MPVQPSLRMQVNIQYAKTHLSRLLRLVAASTELVIARAGVPVARLVAVEAKKVRPLGFDKDKIWIAEDFDAPLPEDLLKEFYGGKVPKIMKSRRKRK